MLLLGGAHLTNKMIELEGLLAYNVVAITFWAAGCCTPWLLCWSCRGCGFMSLGTIYCCINVPSIVERKIGKNNE